MTTEASAESHPAKTIIVAHDVPAEVRDGGKVRMGGGIHVCWLTWEIFQYLPGLMRYWPDGSC